MMRRLPFTPSLPTDAGTAAVVLLVDDYADAREMYAFYLARHGYRVEQAADGHEAWAKAQQVAPSVILLDLSLPGIDGWQLAQMLKQDARTAGIPIIALTAHALNGERARALASGCDAFVTKPCLPEALVAELQRVLQSAGPDSR